MAGAIRTHVTAAGFAIDLRRDLAENRGDHFPGLARAAGHERRALERAFFAAGNAAADEMNPAAFQFLATALGVSEKRIAAVDDHVAFINQRNELLDDGVDRWAGLD